MSATHMRTPVGPWPIEQRLIREHSKMSDRELADKALGGHFICPEAYAELCSRGLSGPGWFKADTYAAIERRETRR